MIPDHPVEYTSTYLLRFADFICSVITPFAQVIMVPTRSFGHLSSHFPSAIRTMQVSPEQCKVRWCFLVPQLPVPADAHSMSDFHDVLFVKELDLRVKRDILSTCGRNDPSEIEIGVDDGADCVLVPSNDRLPIVYPRLFRESIRILIQIVDDTSYSPSREHFSINLLHSFKVVLVKDITSRLLSFFKHVWKCSSCSSSFLPSELVSLVDPLSFFSVLSSALNKQSLKIKDIFLVINPESPLLFAPEVNLRNDVTHTHNSLWKVRVMFLN
jgi:hypothetical protein